MLKTFRAGQLVSVATEDGDKDGVVVHAPSLTKVEVAVEQDVTVIGTINLASTVPYHASQLYARNVTAFLLHLFHDGKFNLDLNDEIIRETLVTHAGEIVNPRVREFFSL